jgi:hypothetical protein
MTSIHTYHKLSLSYSYHLFEFFYFVQHISFYLYFILSHYMISLFHCIPAYGGSGRGDAVVQGAVKGVHDVASGKVDTMDR